MVEQKSKEAIQVCVQKRKLNFQLKDPQLSIQKELNCINSFVFLHGYNNKNRNRTRPPLVQSPKSKRLGKARLK